VFLRVFLCALLIFTVYVLLDTFVIVRRLEPAAEPQTTSAQTAGAEETTAADTPIVTQLSVPAQEKSGAGTVTTENSYTDGDLSVVITEERVGDTTVYVADVKLASADRLRTAFALDSYGRNVTDKTSSIANTVNAVLAINGDFYGVQQSGYVIRNGVLYRSTAKRGAEDLVIYADGSFGIIREAEVTAQELLEQGAQNVLSFGPALVENGEISVSVNDEVGRAKASNPRTAIAVIDELHYLFVVSDGRTNESEGLSLYELAAFLQSRGAQTAYNLDGGGSSTMVFNGLVVNKPTSGGSIKERSVSDIVYVG
jgi:exopolysaccharide biosynthesis protein